MKRGTDKTEVLNAVFASVFTDGVLGEWIQGAGEKLESG